MGLVIDAARRGCSSWQLNEQVIKTISWGVKSSAADDVCAVSKAEDADAKAENDHSPNLFSCIDPSRQISLGDRCYSPNVLLDFCSNWPCINAPAKFEDRSFTRSWDSDWSFGWGWGRGGRRGSGIYQNQNKGTCNRTIHCGPSNNIFVLSCILYRSPEEYTYNSSTINIVLVIRNSYYRYNKSILGKLYSVLQTSFSRICITEFEELNEFWWIFALAATSRIRGYFYNEMRYICLLYTSPSPRD